MKRFKPILFAVSLVFCFPALQLQAQTNTLFDSNTVSFTEMAIQPVARLKSTIDSKKFHLIKEQFSEKIACEKFLNRFNMLDGEKIIPGCFKRPPIAIIIEPPIPIGAKPIPDHKVDMEFTKIGDPNNSIIASCTTVFDVNAKQYMIGDISFFGDIPGLDCPPIPPVPPTPPLDLFISQCAQNESAEFTYIKLRSRANPTAPINDPVILGETPNNANIFIPDDYFNSVIFRQIPFQPFNYSGLVPKDTLQNFQIENPLYTVCRIVFSHNFCTNTLGISKFITIPKFIQVLLTGLITYNPGYVISIEDNTNPMVDNPNPFNDVYDADGVFRVPNAGGTFVSYSTGFFLDRRLKAITIFTANNEDIRYGLKVSQFRFNDPIAVTAAGKHLFVLDKGTNNKIAVFSFGLNISGDFVFTFEGVTDFGLNLTTAGDITSFESSTENVLYIANPSGEGSITRIILDKNTGFQKNGADGPRTTTSAVNFNGDRVPLGAIERLETSLRNTGSGHNTIIAIWSNTKILALSTDGLAPTEEMALNFTYTFPFGSSLRNVGYNIGNNSFYVTDYLKHKVHAFSNDGEYLGSGGNFGQGETDNELYFPNVISSNTFETNTKEMVVCSKWGELTGFKKFAPLPDIGTVEVIEKAPITPAGFNQNSLNFVFSLTDGTGVDEISISINNTLIKTLNSSNTVFLPNGYSNNFLVTTSPPNGLAGLLDYGWNTYTVILIAHVDIGAQTFSYTRTKEIQFYHIPSSIPIQTFLVDNTSSADLFHNGTDDPFVIYKNVFAAGDTIITGINLIIQNGKTIFLEGCVLTVNKPTTFLADNEVFEFTCGSNLKLIMQSGKSKKATNTHFRGTFQSDRMVTCLGDFTGAPGINSAQTSDLEFISCTFDQYFGVALDVVQGRATLANCNFSPTSNKSNTTTGIFVSPSARIDVIGCSFVDNDIAIDADLADLFIGSIIQNYKGVNLSLNTFSNNRIGIHAAETNSKIILTQFTGNDAALMHLSGSLDIEQNSKNKFENNNQGIVFSDVLLGDQGKNQFIDNTIDITYIMPLPISQSAPITFDLECNLWQHGASDQPIFDVISDPPPYNPFSGLVTFDFTPQLKKNTQGHGVTCTGGNPKFKTSQNTTVYHAGMHQLYNLVENGNANLFYPAINDVIQEEQQTVKSGYYINKKDTVKSYREAMVKNALYSLFLKNRANSDIAGDGNYLALGDKIFNKQILQTGFQKPEFYWVTKDRLAFLEFFFKESSSYKHYQQPMYELDNNLNTVEFFPNPVNSQATLRITIAESDLYSLELYNLMGQKVKTIMNGAELTSGQRNITLDTREFKEGIYLGYFTNSNKTVSYKWKFIIVR